MFSCESLKNYELPFLLELVYLYVSGVFAFACKAKSFPIAIISSFSFSLQKIWTSRPNLLVKLSRFIKLGECGINQTLKELYMKNVYWKMWKHDMLCASEKIMAEANGHIGKHVNVINFFMMWSQSYALRIPWPGFYKKLSMFSVVALFTVTIIHRKKYKK